MQWGGRYKYSLWCPIAVAPSLWRAQSLLKRQMLLSDGKLLPHRLDQAVQELTRQLILLRIAASSSGLAFSYAKLSQLRWLNGCVRESEYFFGLHFCNC